MSFSSSFFLDTLEVKLDKIMFLISFCVTFAFGFGDSLSSKFAFTSLVSSWEFWEKLDYSLSSESILMILIFFESSLLENIILSWEFSDFDSSIWFRWDCCLSSNLVGLSTLISLDLLLDLEFIEMSHCMTFCLLLPQDIDLDFLLFVVLICLKLKI